MGSVKLSQGRSFAPLYGWTRQDYEDALLRAVPAAPTVRPVDPPRGLSGLLGAIGTPLPWQADALCREYPDVDWFADNAAQAKAICDRCLVQSECRTAGEHEHGVWGATTSRERARLRRAKVA